jgi:hypothetical protein
MYLEEKLDKLKRDLFPNDLTIRYNDFKQIMSKIESKFLIDDLNFKYSGWIERLKDFKKYDLNANPFDFLKPRLIDDQKYWWIYVEGPYNNSRHWLFDATIKGGYHLSFLFSDSPIFVVHKKYDWMIMIDNKSKLIKERYIEKT